MSNYQFTFENLKKHVFGNINDMKGITLEYCEDIKQRLIDELEENHYDEAPSVDYLHEAWGIMDSELHKNTDYEKPDFSLCESAYDAVYAEARAIVYAAHYEAIEEVCRELADAIDDCFRHDFNNLELTEMCIGKSGLGHIPHDYEVDAGEGSMCVWLASKMVEVTTNGVTLYGKLTEIE